MYLSYTVLLYILVTLFIKINFILICSISRNGLVFNSVQLKQLNQRVYNCANSIKRLLSWLFNVPSWPQTQLSSLFKKRFFFYYFICDDCWNSRWWRRRCKTLFFNFFPKIIKIVTILRSSNEYKNKNKILTNLNISNKNSQN